MKYSIFLIGEIFELWMYNNLWCSLHAGVKHSQHTLELMIWCMRKDFYHLNQVIGIGALPLTSSQRSIVYFVQRYPNPIVLFLHVIYACCAVPVHLCPQNKLLMPVNCCKVHLVWLFCVIEIFLCFFDSLTMIFATGLGYHP